MGATGRGASANDAGLSRNCRRAIATTCGHALAAPPVPEPKYTPWAVSPTWLCPSAREGRACLARGSKHALPLASAVAKSRQRKRVLLGADPGNPQGAHGCGALRRGCLHQLRARPPPGDGLDKNGSTGRR
jgi:hypothetical protein